MAETIWWCEHNGEGIRLRSAYGETTWVNYCIPHIDWPHRPRRGDSPSPEQLENQHKECGLRTV